MDSRDDRKRPQQGLRVNSRIRVPEVRVIQHDGTQLGVMPPYEALRLAQEQELDLVEISPRAVPPVCKIMDFGKYKFEQSKSKQHKPTSTTKEVKFRPKTEAHDLDFKTRHVQEFLAEGHKVRLVVAFRGREIVHPNIGSALLERIAAGLVEAEQATIEQRPNMEGRQMFMILAPKAKR